MKSSASRAAASTPPEPDLTPDERAARLEQIIVNVLNNAAKYTPPAGAITVAAAEERGEAVLRVRDTGIGISKDMLPRIFEPFQRFDDRIMKFWTDLLNGFIAGIGPGSIGEQGDGKLTLSIDP